MATITELKRRIENVQPKTYDSHFEYEAGGAFYFTAFTRRGAGDSEKFAVRLWFDSDGALFGVCSCRQNSCRHIQRSVENLLTGGVKK